MSVIKTNYLEAFARWSAVCGANLTLLLSWPSAAAAQLTSVRDLETSGTFQSLNTGELTIVDADGKTQVMKIQSTADDWIPADGGRVALNAQAEISVRGQANLSALRPGMTLQVHAEIGKSSKTGATTLIEILPIGSATREVEFVEAPPDGREFAAATVVGSLVEADSRRLTLAVPKHDWAPRGKLVFEIEGIETARFQRTALGDLVAGDVISNARATELSSGELIVRSISAQKVDPVEQFTISVDDELTLKFWELSDEPVAPREVRSQHFLLNTDLSPRQTSILLEKLETMVGLISDYYGKSLRTQVPCVVVGDLSRWDTSLFDAAVVNKFRRGEGMTVYIRQGRQQQATVYAASRHGVVQHEAVHAFCFLSFGSTGPLWYAEGMAEMGMYWRPGEPSVQVDPMVIAYLNNTEPQSLLGIVTAERIEGEAWKAYAWRWALCHLMANNPNYSRPFKRLGLNLMRGRNDTFTDTFGNAAAEISFEYSLFLKNLKNGYRVDLCAWDWGVKPKRLGRGSQSVMKIEAARGWQPTKVLLESGQRYQITTDGNWQTSADTGDVSADGDEQGVGRLVGAIMNNYSLAEPFELGADVEFTAAGDGQLCLRCQENFSQISDNQGALSVKIKKLIEE